MVDVWYNKGLDPANRLTWEEFYIEQLKDMEQDAEVRRYASIDIFLQSHIAQQRSSQPLIALSLLSSRRTHHSTHRGKIDIDEFSDTEE